jgi:hypothetical protein
MGAECGSAVLAFSPRGSHGSRPMKIVAAQSSARVTAKYGYLGSPVTVDIPRSTGTCAIKVCSLLNALSCRCKAVRSDAGASLFHRVSVRPQQAMCWPSNNKANDFLALQLGFLLTKGCLIVDLNFTSPCSLAAAQQGKKQLRLDCEYGPPSTRKNTNTTLLSSYFDRYSSWF